METKDISKKVFPARLGKLAVYLGVSLDTDGFGDELPSVDAKDKSYKFVQLELIVNVRRYHPLVCSRTSQEENGKIIHSDIIRDYLTRKGVHCTMIENKFTRGVKITAPEGGDEIAMYRLVGAGYWIALAPGVANCQGDSADYKFGVNKEHLEIVRKNHPEFEIVH